MIIKISFRTAVLGSVSLFVFLFCAGAAMDSRLPAVRPDVRKDGVKPGDKLQAASEVKAPNGVADGMNYTDFDYFSNVNDPLYREGSKALLKKAIDEDNLPKTAVKKTRGKPELMRDAPADTPAARGRTHGTKSGDEYKAPIFPMKKNRLIKMVPADPVKSKSIL